MGGQMVLGQGKACRDVSGGKQAVVANPDVAGREDMEQKAPEEFDLAAGLGLAVPSAEGDGAVADPERAVIADADAVGIAS